MKKTFIMLASGILLFSSVSVISCGGNSTDTEAKKDTMAAPVVEQKDPAIQEGLELIGKSDCLTCHKINEAAVGPAYTLVAAKYAGNQVGQDSLVHKIIKGGSGNWGQVMMPQHPNLAEADVKKMVTYVMSLKPEN